MYFSEISLACSSKARSNCAAHFSAWAASPAAAAWVSRKKSSWGNFESMGKSASSSSREAGMRTANSTRCWVLGSTCALHTYCPGAKVSSNSARSCTSPHTPLVLTLPNSFFRSVTLSANCRISPKPRCTSANCRFTTEKDSERRPSSFSDTVWRICSSF